MNDRNVLLRALAPTISSDVAPSELIAQQMNEVLACDDACYDEVRQEIIDDPQAMIMEEDDGPTMLSRTTGETLGAQNVAESETLQVAEMLPVFDDITHFQVGLLKPAYSHSACQQPAFVPIFPFLYESLECGDIIMDREKALSLHI